MNKKFINAFIISVLVFCGTCVNAKEPAVIELQSPKGTIEENKILEQQPLKGSIEKYGELHIINDIQLDINDVDGPGRASSSLTDGTRYLENVNLYGKGRLGKLEYLFNAGGRATSDDRVDIKGMTLTSLKGQATYEDHTVTVGDVFESFSQYTLNTSLKGASYKFYNETDNLPEFTAVYGYAYPRWDSMFKSEDVQTMRRRAYGANLRKNLTDKLDLGISYIGSMDGDRKSDSDVQYRNNVYSADYEYRPIPGLTIRGENAFNNGEKQYDPTRRYSSYFGHAHRIEAIGVGGPSRVTLGYEYVNPKFESLLGSAAQNRQKANAKWKYNVAKNTTMDTAFMWYQTGLNKGKQSVQTFRPEIGFTRKNFLNRRYAQAGIGYKLNISDGNHSKTNDHFIDMSYRDRFGFLDMDNTFGFTNYNTTKRGRQTYDYNYHTTLSSRHNVGPLVIKPSLSAGTNFVDDEIRNTLDKITDYSVGLGVDVPKYKLTTNMKFGQNILNTGNSVDSDKLFTNVSIYYKPTFIGFLNGSTFFVRIALNDFNFSTRTRNFTERSISMGMNMPVDLSFGKKKQPKVTL